MGAIGDTASGVAKQGSSNLKSGLGGGLAIGLGSAVAGNTLGPILGGVAGGYMLEGQDADTVTQFGMMYGIANAFGGGGGGGTTQSSGVK